MSHFFGDYNEMKLWHYLILFIAHEENAISVQTTLQESRHLWAVRAGNGQQNKTNTKAGLCNRTLWSLQEQLTQPWTEVILFGFW